MGQSLQFIMEEEEEFLSEKAVLQLACRIVSINLYDCLLNHILDLKKIHDPELVKNYDSSSLINCNISFSLQLDVLQYIHSNEYVHADINAENIYIKPGQKSQVRNIL